MFFLSKWPVSTQSPSLSFQAETFPPQSEKHQMSLARHRLKPSGLSSRGLPEQWVYVLHLPSTWHRIGLVAISGWNQQGNKRNTSSIKVFCGLAFVWTPSSKIQVQYEGFLQIPNIFQPCPDIKIFPRLKGLHQWWPPEVQTCEAFENVCFRSRISSLKRESFG